MPPRLEIALQRQPLFVGRPQLLGELVEPAARLAQCILSSGALAQPVLEAGASGPVVEPRKLAGGSADIGFELRRIGSSNLGRMIS